MARWGLTPSWGKDIKIGYLTCYARCEDVERKPVFRDAFKRPPLPDPARRFYEWKKLGGKEK